MLEILLDISRWVGGAAALLVFIAGVFAALVIAGVFTGAI